MIKFNKGEVLQSYKCQGLCLCLKHGCGELPDKENGREGRLILFMVFKVSFSHAGKVC